MNYSPSLASSTAANLSSGLAADAQSLAKLKLEAGKTTPESIRETAKQFEALFMGELLKSMRQATMKTGMFDSPGSDLGADLLDQQYAVQMSGQRGGLSELIAQHLSRQAGVDDANLPPLPWRNVGPLPAAAQSTLDRFTPNTARKAASAIAAPVTATPVQAPPVSGPAPAPSSPLAVTPADAAGALPAPSAAQARFVQQHAAAALRAQQSSGIPAAYLLGQAGHESGWGRASMQQADGSPAHNLFGIKATADWKGPVAQVQTTEYVNGVAQKTQARFRAYGSYEESFQDYARMVSNSPRYAQAMQQTQSAAAFANSLQKAGYATDPHYAAKLTRAINTTLSVGLNTAMNATQPLPRRQA